MYKLPSTSYDIDCFTAVTRRGLDGSRHAHHSPR